MALKAKRRKPALDISLARAVRLDIGLAFGQKVRVMRRRRNLTQLELAIHFGVDRSYVSDVERGRRSPTLHMLYLFAQGFDMSLSELLKGIH